MSVGSDAARQRIDLLLDPESFVELDVLARARSPLPGGRGRPAGDGVITGQGTIDGRPVYVFSQDVTVFHGALGEVHGQKIVKIMELAGRNGCPIVGINDAAGGRIQEGVAAQKAYGDIFFNNVRFSGVVPQISLILGTCAGGACYSPALTDFVVMVDQSSHMFITGPEVVRAATGEDVTLEDLGGARANAVRSGNAHYVGSSEADALLYVRELLSFLPSNNLSESPVLGGPTDASVTASDRELDTLIPDSRRAAYDMRDVITRVVDDEFVEVQALFAPNVIVGFGRVEGRAIGVVANQPTYLAGCLDIDASEKAARFVRTCDAFNIPILTFVDVPGFLPGSDQEWNGIIRRGAKLIYAYAAATVPTITVITRKAYGGAYDVMGSKHLRSDVSLAWPTAEIAVMGADAAVRILHRRTLSAAAESGEDVEELRARLVAEYEDEHCTPYSAAERGWVDSVIPPSRTRMAVTSWLRLLREKREVGLPRKHGNMPI